MSKLYGTMVNVKGKDVYVVSSKIVVLQILFCMYKIRVKETHN